MRRHRSRTFTLTALAVSAACASWFAAPATATPAKVLMSFRVPVSVTTAIDGASFCDNTGPHITFSSTLFVGDHWVRLDFRNNTQGTHTADAFGQVALGLSQTGNDGNPSVAKQPPLGGAGGNPFIYFEQDVSGNNAGPTWYLGRCVQDFGHGYDNPNSRFTASGSIAGFVQLVAQSTGCSNKGSSLTIGGNVGRDAVKGHLILTNSYWGASMPTPQHIDNTDIVATATVQLVDPAGGTIPKQPPLGGPGGNPQIYANTGVYNAGGTPPWTPDPGTTDPGTYLGKCNQLG